MEKNSQKNKLSKILDNIEEIDLILSYSKIANFDIEGASSLIKKIHKDNDGIKFGSIVDDLLFQNKEFFNKKYYIYDGNKPTATLGLLCDIIIKNYSQIPTKKDILEIINLNNFWKRQKEETLLANFDIPEFWEYLKCQFETVNKTIITSKEYSDAQEVVSILKTHKYCKSILNNNLDNYYQFKFEINYKQFKFRGILDIISIDHINKIVYFTDIKTGKNSTDEFMDSFIKWRYYFQGAIYSLAFKEICNKIDLKDYTLAPFQFLYISRYEKLPLIFKMTQKWYRAAINGFNIGKYKYKGINELCDDIYWCWKNKEYEIPKYIIESNGIVELKDNFIDLNE